MLKCIKTALVDASDHDDLATTQKRIRLTTGGWEQRRRDTTAGGWTLLDFKVQ